MRDPFTGLRIRYTTNWDYPYDVIDMKKGKSGTWEVVPKPKMTKIQYEEYDHHFVFFDEVAPITSDLITKLLKGSVTWTGKKR